MSSGCPFMPVSDWCKFCKKENFLLPVTKKKNRLLTLETDGAMNIPPSSGKPREDGLNTIRAHSSDDVRLRDVNCIRTINFREKVRSATVWFEKRNVVRQQNGQQNDADGLHPGRTNRSNSKFRW